MPKYFVYIIEELLHEQAKYEVKYYKDDPCTEFMHKVKQEDICNNHEIDLVAKMYKAIAILQVKVEYEIIKRHKD